MLGMMILRDVDTMNGIGRSATFALMCGKKSKKKKKLKAILIQINII